MGRAIVMGRRTFESMKRPLPGRLNVVLTRDPTFAHAGVEIARSLDEALAIGARHHEEVMIIGGAAVYAEALPRCDRMILTIVEGRFEGDALFPPLEPNAWRVRDRTHHAADEANAWATTVYDLVRSSTVPSTTLPVFTWADVSPGTVT